jgi:type IV pilus assembly protein PilB
VRESDTGPGAGIATIDQLVAALENQKAMHHPRLGDALVQDGSITVQQRDDALAVQRSEYHKQVGRILVEAGALRREVLNRVLVEGLGVPRVDPGRFEVQRQALAAISPELARKLNAVPLYRSTMRMAVALEDPMDWAKLDELERSAGVKIDPVIASRAELRLALRKYYGVKARKPSRNPPFIDTLP